jgi:hypothetical protein
VPKSWPKLIALTCLLACDIPTDVPRWHTNFVIKTDYTTIAVSQILPGSVTLNPTGIAFSIGLSPAVISERLGVLCSACTALDNTTAAKPAFKGGFAGKISLPADVVLAAITSGVIEMEVQNGLSFDPVRPAASASGSIAVVCSNGVQCLATLREPLQPGSTFRTSAAIRSFSYIDAPFDIQVTMDSPAGDPVAIKTTQRVTATLRPSTVLAELLKVRVQDRQITAQPQTLDLRGVDDFVIRQTKRGILHFDIENPWNVSGELTLTIYGSATPVIKKVALQPGQQRSDVALDKADLLSMLGRNLTLTLSGPVSAADAIEVKPTDFVKLKSQLELVLGPEN